MLWSRAFSRSDWRHTFCVTICDRLFWLFRWRSQIPPYAKRTLSIDSQCKNYWKLSKTFKSSWNHTIYSGYNAHMFALLISKLQETLIEKSPCINPMGIRECCPLFQYSGWGTRSGGTASDHENLISKQEVPGSNPGNKFLISWPPYIITLLS